MQKFKASIDINFSNVRVQAYVIGHTYVNPEASKYTKKRVAFQTNVQKRNKRKYQLRQTYEATD